MPEVAVHNRSSISHRRVRALVLKESRQILRDPSSVAIGIVLPLLLILLFGYGVSLNVEHVPVAIVLERSSPAARELAGRFSLSRYFAPTICRTFAEAQELMRRREVDAIIAMQAGFAKDFADGSAKVQVLVHGTDANRARIIQRYAQGVIGQWAQIDASDSRRTYAGPVGVHERVWFNEAAESRHFLVPGLIVLIMTLIGALLTALVMSREWERGTFEALFVTPVKTEEILLGKTVPYFALGIGGLALCLLSARLLFDVPFRGSILVFAVVSILYLIVALEIGLFISSLVKSQFVASQMALLITFMPALMLSGFLFDLRSMPPVVRGITYLLPARYYVALLQTIFLAGNVWSVILPNAAVLACMALGLLLLTRRITRKEL